MESLGNRLHRSVAFDDPELKLLAYSPHVNDVDTARTVSILTRSLPHEVVDFVYELGAGTARDLFSVPSRADLGMDIARVAMPVYHHESLFGFIWLLTSEGPVTEEDADAVRQAAESAGVIMHREYLLGSISRSRETELGRDLLDEDRATRRRAAEQLLAENLFVSDAALAMVVALRCAGHVTEDDRLALDAGVEFGRRQREQRRVLTVGRLDHAVLILSREGSSARQSLFELGSAVRKRVLAETREGTTCWVGIGSAQAGLETVRASYLQASRAAEVASMVKVLGAVVHRTQLGVYGLLASVPADQLIEHMHPGVRTLVSRGAPGDDTLVHTLETFLDNAGDVKRTSDQLLIHRTSLYYRLKRVKEITELDLSVGDDRLALHLGLKMAQLIENR